MKTEKWSIFYHKSEDILKKTDFFLGYLNYAGLSYFEKIFADTKYQQEE